MSKVGEFVIDVIKREAAQQRLQRTHSLRSMQAEATLREKIARFGRIGAIMEMSLAVTNVTAKPNITPLTVAGG